MSHSMITVTGRLGQDPEFLGKDDAVAKFGLAEDYWAVVNGEGVDQTQWYNVVIFKDRLVRGICKHLKKGALVTVSGVMRSSKYVDKNSGEERMSWQLEIGDAGTLSPIRIGKPKGESDDEAAEENESVEA